MNSVSILGCTGTIGLNALSVIDNFPSLFKLNLILANSSCDKMLELILKYQPRYAALMNFDAYIKLKENLPASCSTKLINSWDEVCCLLSSKDTDIVISAIVGSIGLKPTLSAIRAGKKILLANKEALVMAGDMFMEEALAHGSQILPLDSEHSALFQCLPDVAKTNLGNLNIDSLGINKLILTASGGPFLGRTKKELLNVSVADACSHPNWKMGAKISVDSATLMNKGLEYIEAKYLFNTSLEQLDVIIHPQSIIHSMISYKDGSILAQLGDSDMKIPILYALFYPLRQEMLPKPKHLDFAKISSLDFQEPDHSTFPNLNLAIQAVKSCQERVVALNAINEINVSYFLNNKISFLDISYFNQKFLNEIDFLYKCNNIDDLVHLDFLVRNYVIDSFALDNIL